MNNTRINNAIATSPWRSMFMMGAAVFLMATGVMGNTSTMEDTLVFFVTVVLGLTVVNSHANFTEVLNYLEKLDNKGFKLSPEVWGSVTANCIKFNIVCIFMIVFGIILKISQMDVLLTPSVTDFKVAVAFVMGLTCILIAGTDPIKILKELNKSEDDNPKETKNETKFDPHAR